MNLGPLADMHPVEQAIRAQIEPHWCDGAGSALLAVLDLHKPRLRPGRKYEHDPMQYDCKHCHSIGNGGFMSSSYPCETVERIADALGVTP